jgi:hypothetical protein
MNKNAEFKQEPVDRRPSRRKASTQFPLHAARLAVYVETEKYGPGSSDLMIKGLTYCMLATWHMQGSYTCIVWYGFSLMTTVDFGLEMLPGLFRCPKYRDFLSNCTQRNRNNYFDAAAN